MSAESELTAIAVQHGVPGLLLRAGLDAFRAEVRTEALKDAAAICRTQAPKYLDNEVDTAIFWALDSAAGKIVADDKT